ncbi:MAG TPA: hypothetical protein VI545_02295 [Burkholderiales bacterium]|nr:hypothetical protein [Burkholderiales bacterium]
MKAISYAFFVTEAEYPKLQAACPGDFPYTYAQFSARVDQSIRDTADTVAVEKVYASVDHFLAWCAEAKVQPSNISRARYAVVIGHPQSSDTEG